PVTTTVARSVMAGTKLVEDGHRTVHCGHPGELLVGQVELDAVPLLDLVHEPRQLQGVDALADLARRPVGQPGERRHHLGTRHRAAPRNAARSRTSFPVAVRGIAANGYQRLGILNGAIRRASSSSTLSTLAPSTRTTYASTEPSKP